jgi:hypothetical protein
MYSISSCLQQYFALQLQLSPLAMQLFSSKSVLKSTIAHGGRAGLCTTTGNSADGGHSPQQSDCHIEVLQHAQAVLTACPGLPGYCVRNSSLHDKNSTDYLNHDGPADAGMRQQKLQVERFVRGSGLQVGDEQTVVAELSPVMHTGLTNMNSCSCPSPNQWKWHVGQPLGLPWQAHQNSSRMDEGADIIRVVLAGTLEAPTATP